MNNTLDALKQQIIDYVSTVAGLHGFASINLQDDELPRSLKAENQTKSLFIMDGAKGLIVKIAIIIKLQINAKAIVQGVHQAIQTIVKQSNNRLDSIDIYIRGAMA